MNSNNIKKLIILVSILIVIIIIIIIMSIIVNKSSVEDNIQEEIEQFDSGLQYEENDNGFQILNDPNVFFSVMESLDTYFEILEFDTENTEYVNHYEIEDEDNLKQIILQDMLDQTYVMENNINEDNFYEYIPLMNYGYNVIPIELRVRYEDDGTIYISSVYIENMETNQLEKRYYIIRIDQDNFTFSIEPVQGNIESIDDIQVSESNLKIENHIYNKFSIKTISTEELIKKYMSHFMNILINHTEIAYENYLDEEYKKKRFGELEQLMDFVNKNKEELNGVEPSQYLVEFDDNAKKYVILDQYQNTYEFYETATMVYKVRLDTYTIMPDNFKETYDSSNEQYKVAMNIDKWIDMLNNRDYHSAYQYLDETFRNNNFGSEEAFEQYMREHFPLHYQLKIGQFTETNNTYTQYIVLTDITGETNEEIDNTIIMQLKDDYDFVMSFSVQ